jgi:hypothetical protein
MVVFISPAAANATPLLTNRRNSGIADRESFSAFQQLAEWIWASDRVLVPLSVNRSRAFNGMIEVD